VVDPAQSYYRNIAYRASADYQNLSNIDPIVHRSPDAPCLDSSQAWFCRDLWVAKAKEAMEEMDSANAPARRKRDVDVVARNEDLGRRQAPEFDPDANAGSDYDAMPDSDVPLADVTPPKLLIPNSIFRPARILVNPRCVTTYAGVSHTQLALDLFGPEGDDEQPNGGRGKYVLEDWEGAPDSFVCQEQRYVPHSVFLSLSSNLMS
jgi:hypothetical protein